MTHRHYRGGMIDRNVVVNKFELTLNMPMLLKADVEKSSVWLLRVATREKGIVKYVIIESSRNVVELGL